MAEAVKQNLTGLRVLDITQYIAGPTLGRMLADLGAEVVKLEMPPGGEYSRRGGFPPRVEGQSPNYIYYNRGKRCICIDFKRPEGAAIVVELARHFDVVIENYTPGVLSKYGLTYEAFKEVNPKNHHVLGFRLRPDRLAGWPSRQRHDRAGAFRTAAPDRHRRRDAGLSRNVPCRRRRRSKRRRGGIGRAVLPRPHRNRTVHRRRVYECVFHIHDVFLMQHMFTYGDYNPGPTGRHRPGATPCGLFKTRDGWIVFTVLNHNWERFTKDIGKPELLTDPRFNPYYVRWDNRHLLEPMVEEWFESIGGRDEVLKFLLDRHYLAAPVMDLRETVEMVKEEGRGALQNLDVPGYGEIPLPKVPYLFSETNVEFKPILSMVGEDNRAILSEFLGYSEQKLDELEAAGILLEDRELAEIRDRRK